jgi:hypothetical protein
MRRPHTGLYIVLALLFGVFAAWAGLKVLALL